MSERWSFRVEKDVEIAVSAAIQKWDCTRTEALHRIIRMWWDEHGEEVPMSDAERGIVNAKNVIEDAENQFGRQRANHKQKMYDAVQQKWINRAPYSDVELYMESGFRQVAQIHDDYSEDANCEAFLDALLKWYRTNEGEDKKYPLRSKIERLAERHGGD